MPGIDDLAPPEPAADLEVLAGASFRSPGKALAPAMTLKRIYHCVPRIISGVSQMSGLRREINDDARRSHREQQVGGESGQELRDRLHRGAPRPGAGRSRRRSAPRLTAASTISTTTRSRVIRPRPHGRISPRSDQVSAVPTRSRRSARSPRAPRGPRRATARKTRIRPMPGASRATIRGVPRNPWQAPNFRPQGAPKASNGRPDVAGTGRAAAWVRRSSVEHPRVLGVL